MPRYEKKESRGIAFWAVHVGDDGELLIHDGLAGTNGKERTKKLATFELAQVEADRLIAQRLKKGWLPAKTLPRGRSSPEVRGLEEAIARSPDDLEPFVVYADWLQEHGDELGELITLSLAHEDAVLAGDTAKETDLAKTIAAWRDDHDDGVFGEVSKHLKRLTLTWRRGLVRSARIRSGPKELGVSQGELVGALLSLPVGRFITQLAFPASAYTDCSLAFADLRPRALRSLAIEPGTGSARLKLARLNVLENLRELSIGWSSLDATGLSLPHVESLSVTDGQALVDGGASLPALRRVELLGWGSVNHAYIAAFPNVTTVAIRNVVSVMDTVSGIARNLPQVQVIEAPGRSMKALREEADSRGVRADITFAPLPTPAFL